MIIDFKKKLAFLAIPKCASTTVEKVLNEAVGKSVIQLRGGLKHTKFKEVEKFIIPFLKSKGIQRPHFFAVMREPAERLLSSYLYRTRVELLMAPENSNLRKRYTGNISFSDFVKMNTEPYHREKSTPPTFITETQLSFLQDSSGKIGVDTIIPIQYLNDYLPAFLNQFGYNVLKQNRYNVPIQNQSPKSSHTLLNDDLRNAINTSDRFMQDYEYFIQATKHYEKEKF